MEGIEAYIEQLHEVDSGSFGFRYAVDKKGAPSLPNVDRINLRNFSDHMEGLCNYLEGFDTVYAESIQLRNEMYSEMDDDYYGDDGDY